MTTPKPALPEPVPPNAEGSTTCIVRWMVTTRDGLWLGAWDKEAFAAYTQFAIDAAAAEARAEIANLKTVMIAAAEEIAAHWEAHCDAEGYGPQNLLRRLEEGIPSEYGYTAGAFAELKAKAEARAVPEWPCACDEQGRGEPGVTCGDCPRDYGHCVTPSPVEQSKPAVLDELLAWAVSRWESEVRHRPLVNKNRRSLDDTWRQVIRFAGGDPDALLGPAHDALLAALQGEPHDQA